MRDSPYTMRRWLGAILLLGILGVSAELVLIEHDEDLQQLVPLIASGASVTALGWYSLSRGRPARLALRAAMLGLVASAAYGLWLHYQSNEEFQRELDPDLEGWGLVLETMRSSSPPSLAPGVLALLGAIGWIATLGRGPDPSPEPKSTR